MPYGDSKTQGQGDDTPPALGSNGYPPLLTALLSTATGRTWVEDPLRVGRAGFTTAQLKAVVDADLLARGGPPAAVIVNVGTNDIGGASPTTDGVQLKSDYGYILDAIHVKWPNASIYCAKLWRASTNGQQNTFDDTWLPAVLSTRPFAHTGIDERLILPGASGVGTEYTVDGTHPNRAGYGLVAAAWKTAMGY